MHSQPTLLSISSDGRVHALLRLALEAEGARILAASSLEDGLGSLSHDPDLVLIEASRPEQGVETCRELKRRAFARGPAVILISPPADAVDLSGIDAYLTDPISPQLLGITVRLLLRAREAEEAKARLEAELKRQGYGQPAPSAERAPNSAPPLPPGEERLRVPAEPIPGTLWTTDPNMRLVFVSGESLATVGIDLEELREQQNLVLRLVATGAPLGEVLTLVVRYIESKLPGVLGSVVLVDADQRLRVIAAPSMPDSYNRAIDGLPIGPQVGSCGTAAWRKATVIVRDIAEDELWAPYREIAAAAGVRSCWSTPISDGTRVVIGTFALYGREPREPSEEEVRLVGFLTDLARIAICHHLTQEALRQSEQRFRELAENLTQVFWVYDAERRTLVYVSPAYERIWGRPSSFPLRPGYSPLDYVHPDDRERAQVFQERHQQGVHSEADYRIVRPDGDERWIWARTIPIRFTDGRLLRMLGIAEDISERKRVEAQVLQSQRLEAVGRLAGGVAHDFNNMLAVINGYSSLLLAGLLETDPCYESIREILRAGERAAGLTQQLLAFSRRQMIAPRVLDLNEIVEQTERMLRPLIGETIELKLRLAPDLGRVRADAGQLQQVLMNLTVNARDAMPAGGRLTIRTENVSIAEAYGLPDYPLAKGDYVALHVSDTGIGIAAEILPHLFEPFFTTKEPGKGTGLGLASVHGIVEQTGGRISVETEVAHGSTFRVLLPRVTDPQEAEASRGLSHLPAGTETILLVEDEPMVRGLAVQILRACGYQVLEAEDGKEALDLFSEQGDTVHLLLTDVVMPGMSGRELAEHLRTRRPDLPVLLMSGYTDDAAVHHGVTESSLAFLNKPFTSASLAGAVRQALDSRNR